LQIKKLQLVGFKTFADKTEIEFSEGITAVVGPNGSGKSNIADALLWVMGEQNPRLLRGNDSRDVIFAGSEMRKPMGMSEVRLTLDNSDRTLATDFKEITITRRIYRSGESQYLINGSACRMKDIVDLFLDTGMGKGAYSFVSQNEIDAVLSSKSEDRRELFEEAAGIKKYRVRKREAVRKLDQAESNLNRIRDLTHELASQLAPMEAQAEQARRYRVLVERLQRIEIDLLIAEAKRQDYELYAARKEQEMDSETIADCERKLALMERDAETVTTELETAEKDLDAARNSRQSALTSRERIENQIALNEEKINSFNMMKTRMELDLSETIRRIQELRERIDKETQSLESLKTSEREKTAALQASQASLNEFEKAYQECVRRNEDRQGALMRLAEQRAQRESALNSCRLRIGEIENRIELLKKAASELSVRRHECLTRMNGNRSLLAALMKRKDELAARRVSIENERRQNLDEQESAAIALDAARRLLAERSSRLNTLVELQESGEGFFQGVRATLKASRDGVLHGEYHPVVELLSVPEHLRVAIEVALASSLQDIVCDTENEAKTAIQWLKKEKAGRATFLPLDMIRLGDVLVKEDVEHMEGVLGIASDHVRIDTRYRNILKLLLGRVILAENMDAAIRTSREVGNWHRIVTLDGELLTPTGSLTGGSLQGRGTHLVGRKGEIDDLKRAMPSLKADVEKYLDLMNRAAQSVNDRAKEMTEVNSSSAQIQSDIASLETELKSVEREISQLDSSLADNQSEIERLFSAQEKLKDEAEEWEKAIELSRQRDISEDDALASESEETKRLLASRDALREKVVELKIERGRLAEKIASLTRSLEADKLALTQSEKTRDSLLNQSESHSGQLGEALQLAKDLIRQRDEIYERVRETERLFEEANANRDRCLKLSFEKRNSIRELNQKRTETMKALHEAELQIARMEVKVAQTAQRLMDDYGMTFEEALLRDDPAEISRSTVNEVTQLRREIKQMGQVNIGAVEEYERLKERHDFLSKQREDLEKARKSLLDTIAEVDESTRDAFMQTFHGVSDNFSRIFQRLFNGGSTKLVLTNPDDLLETGIDVIVQPPGKKAQSLSLLSGGERALTATALLFSFLAYKPSPFVLMDEVDASLDGANVERFVQLIKEYSRQTQFLVITHNPATMEAAPKWYGVTMQETGISKVLAYTVPSDSIPSEMDETIHLQENLPL